MKAGLRPSPRTLPVRFVVRADACALPAAAGWRTTDSEPEVQAAVRCRVPTVLDGPSAWAGSGEGFWADVASLAGPLVNLDPQGDDHRLLTFLWRGDDDTRNVVLLGGPAHGVEEPDSRFEHVAGTDVWAATYRVRADLTITYQLAVDDSLRADDWPQRLRAARPDPWNPHGFDRGTNVANPLPPPTRYSTLRLDAAPAQPDWTPGSAGLTERVVRSRHLGNDRRVWYHVPDGGAVPQGALVLLDGWEWATCYGAVSLVEQLVRDGALPPVAVVLPEARDYLARGVELNGNPAFDAFVVDELLVPFGQELGADWAPERVAVVGQSLGGNGALHLALGRPDAVGHVVAQSSAFAWESGEPSRPAGWLVDVVESAPRPLTGRVYLEAGTLESDALRAATARMADLLGDHGATVRENTYAGDHSWYAWRPGMAAGLRHVGEAW